MGSGTEPENRREGTASGFDASRSTVAKQKLQELRERVKQKEAARSGEQEKKRKRDADNTSGFPGRKEGKCEGQGAIAEDRAGVRHAVRKQTCNQLALDWDQPASNNAGRKRCFSEV